MRFLWLLVAAVLLALPLTAQMVTPELPVSTLPVPDANTTCGVISGATKAYAICDSGGAFYGIDLAADGRPLLPTRTLLDRHFGRYVAAGDTLYSAAAEENAVVVRRADSGAEVRIDAVAAAARLTWNGRSLLLLTYNSGGLTMAAILDTSLRIVVRPFPLPRTAVDLPAQASADGRFLLVARDANNQTTGIILDPDGGTTRTIALATPLPAAYAWDALASSGSDYLHVWERDFGPLVAQRYSSSGEPIGDLQIIALNPNRSVAFPQVVWTGSDYLIVWMDSITSWMCTLGGTPQVIGNGDPGVAAGPAGVFLTLQPEFAPQTIRRLDTSGPEATLSYGLMYQWFAAVATDGVETAAVWNEGHLVRMGRIAADGTPLDGLGVVLPIDVGSTLDSISFGRFAVPAIAFDGVSYLVVWVSESHVLGVFVGRSGNVGKPFVIGDTTYPGDASLPSVTWNGTHYLVTWSTAIVAAQGTITGAGAIVTPSGSVTPLAFASDVFETAVADGPRTLVVFSNLSQPLFAKISGVFLDASGAPFEIGGAEKLNLGRNGLAESPRVVTNGRDYLVTWVLRYYPARSSEAWLAHLDDHGRLIGTPFAVARSDTTIFATAIPLFDGTDYRVVVSGQGDMPLFVARVTDRTFGCGCLDDRIPIPVDFDIVAQGSPIAASAGKGNVVVEYTRWFATDSVYGSSPRIMLRFVRMPRLRAAPRR